MSESRPRRNRNSGNQDRALFASAESKFLGRREWAGDQYRQGLGSNQALMNIRALAEALAQVDTRDLLPDDTRQTFAIGMLQTNIIAAVKGVSNWETYLDTIMLQLRAYLPEAPDPVVITNVEAGLHAEMAVARWCLQNTQYGKWDLAYVLQVACIGKGVCPDCAGWLNKHRIPHLCIRKEGTNAVVDYAIGAPSAGGQWTHPGTGAVFLSNTPGGRPTLETYQKNGRSVNR